MKILSKVLEIIGRNKNDYAAHIIKINPVNLRKGSTVVTPRGIGVVIELFQSIWSTSKSKPEKVTVRLLRKYTKTFNTYELTQYAVLHKPSSSFVLLSPQCYDYVGEERQFVNYRLTKRNYANLTEQCRDDFYHFCLFNKKRGGQSILRNLQSKNFIIKKKWNKKFLRLI